MMNNENRMYFYKTHQNFNLHTSFDKKKTALKQSYEFVEKPI